MCSYPLASYFVFLRPKYIYHPILEHPKPMFLPQYEIPKFTPIQNNRQNYDFMSLNLYIVGYKLADRNCTPNDSKHFLTSVCSLFIHELTFDVLRLFTKARNVPHLQTVYYLSARCDIFLHAGLET
jgi:hypothetical protein